MEIHSRGIDSIPEKWIVEKICEHLLATKFAHDDRATWIGFHMHETPSGYVRSLKTLGSSVYNGNAGIALFLAEASQFLESREILNTAKHAILQALAHKDDIIPHHELSFYTGLVGLLFVASYINSLTRDCRIEEEIEALSLRILAKDVAKCKLDQIHGISSAVPFAIAMDKAGIFKGGIQKAISIAEHLAASLEPSIVGQTWQEANAGTSDGLPLICFSHGTAGMVWPLIEVTAADVSSSYEVQIKSVLAYEDAFWSENERNWYDLRGMTKNQLPSTKYGRFAGHWCHGNVGMYLVRRRTSQLGFEMKCSPTLEEIAEGVDKSVHDSITHRENFSICHGLLGDIEAVENSKTLQDVWTLSNQCAEDLSWHYGLSGRPSPDLFLGIAGIGRAYLNYLGGVGFSVLFPTPEAIEKTLRSLRVDR